MKNVLFAFIFVAIAFNSSAINSVSEKASQKVPSGVSKWIKKELSKAKTKKLIDLNSSAFFCRDSARLVGYIIGYDSLRKEKTGMLYARNVLTKEENAIVMPIYSDGRFEITFPMSHPQQPFLLLLGNSTSFYIEPGQTLGMILGDETEFVGPTAQINKDLNSYTLKSMDYESILEKVKAKMSPEQFKAENDAFLKECNADLDKQLQGKKITPQAETLLRNNVMLAYGSYMIGYENYYYNLPRYLDPKIKDYRLPALLPSDFYNFLGKMPLNDQKLLASSYFGGFINQLEFCNSLYSLIVNNRAGYQAPMKSFEEYIFDELKATLTVEDLAYKVFADSAKTINFKELFKQDSVRAISLQKRYQDITRSFYKRYEEHLPAYQKKYMESITLLSQPKQILETNRLKDSLMNKFSGINPNLVREVILTRSLMYDLKSMKEKDIARNCLSQLEKGITNPFLMEESERVFHIVYPSDEKVAAYELPAGKGTDILRKILEPFKGKTIIIDFWSTYCGPCIGAIKQHKPIIDELNASKEFAYVLITNDEESPEDAYNKLVQEVSLKNTYRISGDDYRYLRQLFNFNAIPRYVLINKDGKVANADFDVSDFRHKLNELK